MTAHLRIAARVAGTSAEGPGQRFALWLQGCSLRCPGCCNPRLFDPRGGETVAVATLLDEIRTPRSRIEGITVLGGEPFEQAAGLAPLLRGVRALGLGIIVFTGFTREDLERNGDDDARGCLASCDLLVDGRFDAAQPERRRRWAGSTNQRFHYLTTRYSPAIERARDGRVDEIVEVRVAPDGLTRRNGWPEPQGRPIGGWPA